MKNPLTIAALTLCALMFSGCTKRTGAAPAKQYTVRGQIVSLDPSGHLAVINSEKIDGWMDAMTMEYPIKDPQEFQKLKPGEKIQGTVFVQGADFWVGGISEAPAGAQSAPPPSR